VRAAIADGGESVAIIQAIVALAEQLGLETTAEGTETRAEFEAMRRLGCGQVQGYYFGRPMPAEDASRMLDRRRPLIELHDEAEVSPKTGPVPSMPAAAHGQSRTVAEPASPPAL
jgi:predicted signal transduction protein with EAL and GGDEF domain